MIGKKDGASLTCVSLFAGGGGLTLGVQAAGFKILLATDADENSEATFRINQPHTPFLRKDIRRIQKDDVLRIIGKEKVDLVIGGPPCQGFSTIGDQIPGDPRNHLFWSFLRIVKWLNPTCFLMENVNYLRSQYAGKYEGEITRAFGSEGYRVYVSTLNSADFGVPQIRRRAFFVGTKHQGDFSWPTPTHSESPRLSIKPYVTVREAIMDIANASSTDVPNHLALNHSERVIRRYKLIPEGGRMPPPQELPADIRRRNFGNTYKRLHRDKPSLTLVPGNNAFPVHPTHDRSLTPREAARLQGFPDSYVFSGNRAAQCRLIGNAVPVALAQRLTEAIRMHLRENFSSTAVASKDPGFESQRAKPAVIGKHLKAVSFFTGAGGLMLGFANAGFEILASYDRKTIVAKNIAVNFPKVPHYHLDIAKLSLKEIRSHIGNQKLDVVFGGPPCQGFSIFGKRRFVKTKGYEVEADERNELTLKYIGLAVALEPSVIFMENVKGLYSASRGSSTYLATIERRLRRAGYDFEHKIINCADYGVPQLRERAVLVAWTKGLVFKWPEAKHHKNPKPWQRAYVTVGDVITDLMDPATISDGFSHVPMAHKPLVVDRYKLIPEGGRLPEDKLTKRLRQGYRTSTVKNYSHVFKRLAMDAPATTMVPGHNAFPVHPRLHRTLTVREAARIQTFPDNIKFLGTRQQQCMLAGNAVPPLLAEIFSHHIVKTIKGNFSDPGYKKDVYELKAHV